MRKVLAVALLDCRRFGFVLVSVGLVAGLLPALAAGLGPKVPPANVLFLVFAVVGLALGGYFGNDFAEGKGSFFFARPLPGWALLAGRFSALVAISAVAFIAFMASYSLSSSEPAVGFLSPLTTRHAAVLAAAWVLSLYFSLGIAAQSPRGGAGVPLRDRFMRLPGVALTIAVALLTFGLFADLVVRAYLTLTPLKVFGGFWVAAAFIASCVAMGAGRSDRSRISRFRNLMTACSLALAAVVVLAVWSYVLHPGPDAIRHVSGARGSLDGRFAYVWTAVDRGDPKRFSPMFVLDIASGQARRLNADPDQGPWVSADGGTMAWSEATPFFFRPLWQALGGARSFRTRTSAGEVEVLPMPQRLPGGFGRGRFLGGIVSDVLPSENGDVFAIRWDRQLTFMSRSRGELSDARLGPGRPDVLARAFLSTGALRVAVVRRDAQAYVLEFMDIEPTSGASKTLFSMEVGLLTSARFDAKAERALVSSQRSAGRTSVSLVDLSQTAGAVRTSVLLPDSRFPAVFFLADGRIAALGGSPDRGPLRVFSATGAPLLDIPLGGHPFLVRCEMFPGILAVRLQTGHPSRQNVSELLLVDSANGAIVRRLPYSYWPPTYYDRPMPPPGTPAARLLGSGDGNLYELPSLTAEPRLLLPLPKR